MKAHIASAMPRQNELTGEGEELGPERADARHSYSCSVRAHAVAHATAAARPGSPLSRRHDAPQLLLLCAGSRGCKSNRCRPPVIATVAATRAIHERRR